MSIKKCLHAILMGIQTGSAVYLIVLALSIQKNPPTTSNIVSVMVMSGLIGIISSILKTFEDRFSFLVSILLHFVAVAVLVCCFMVYNNWGFLIANWHFWLDFILVYLFTWIQILRPRRLIVPWTNAEGKKKASNLLKNVLTSIS